MPRNSIEGSAFPDLEQEGRSMAHTDRAPRQEKKESQSVKEGENKRKDEKTSVRAR